MPHFVDIKKKIKVDILAALDKSGQLNLRKTIALFSLNSGFTEKTVTQILNQMKELSYIELIGDKIQRPNAKTPERPVSTQ